MFFKNYLLFVLGFIAGCIVLYLYSTMQNWSEEGTEMKCPECPERPECPEQNINDCVIKSYKGNGTFNIGMECSKNDESGLTHMIQDVFASSPGERWEESNSSDKINRYDVSKLGTPSNFVFRLYPTPENDPLSRYLSPDNARIYGEERNLNNSAWEERTPIVRPTYWFNRRKNIISDVNPLNDASQ